MARGFGETEAVADLPTVVVGLAALVTQPGDIWFGFLLVGLRYWFGEALPSPLSFDRRRAAFLLALALGSPRGPRRPAGPPKEHGLRFPRFLPRVSAVGAHERAKRGR
jgi:hypothetical protein